MSEIEKQGRANLLKALIKSGYTEKTARNILSGGQKMKDLDRAIYMRDNHDIEVDLWIRIYKK